MTSFFDTRLWNHIVLPMSHAERAVTHAVVALSALHEDVEVRGAPLSREDLANHRHRFALEQYTRALSSLNMRRHSQDPKLREVLLTCCLLFVVFELLLGQYDAAFAHLRQGLSIIQDSRAKEKSPSPSSSVSNSMDDVQTSLAETMARLDVQSVFFGVKVPHLGLSPTDGTDSENEHCLNEFQTLSEARRYLDFLFDRVSRFLEVVNILPVEERLSSSRRLGLGEKQSELRIGLSEYLERLKRSETRLLRSGGKKEQRGFDLIRLHHRTFSVVLETYLAERGDMVWDAYLDGFKEMVALSERISHSFWEESDPDKRSRPTLLLDMGIIPSLLYVCTKCPDSGVRQQALGILEAWPHREGPWDSNLVTILARQVISIETEAEIQRLSAVSAVPSSRDWTYISEPSRVQDVFLTVAEDQTHAVLTYKTKEPGQAASSKEKLIVLDRNS
jgi:hypothetical protein